MIQRFVLSQVLESPLSSGLKCETVRGHKNPIKILDGLSEMLWNTWAAAWTQRSPHPGQRTPPLRVHSRDTGAVTHCTIGNHMDISRMLSGGIF